CLEEAQTTMKTQFDKHVRETPEWKEGEEVWLNSRHISTTRPNAKLTHRWLGPFVISKRISTSAYKLTLPVSMQKVHPVFHVSVLRRHKADMIDGRQAPTPDPIRMEGMDEWEVEEILDGRKKGKKTEFLVSWKGFGPEEDSWEPEQNLQNCKELLEKFTRRFPQATTKHKRRRRMK
ncbi:hypothetical protein PSTG_17762, partial [Puccinia striiformis f. sp. tritici PST-78]